MEVAAIKVAFPEMKPITPGVRLAGGDTQDQARTDTPGGAIRSGAWAVVSGRELTNDETGENFDRIVADIEAALVAA